MQKNDLGLKFKKIRSVLKLTQSDFAKSINTNREVIAKIETNKSIPTFEQLKNVLLVHNVNTNWLINGNGDMFNDFKFFSNDKLTNVDLYDIEALAGNGSIESQKEIIKESWHIPHLVGRHFAMYVSGHSMAPTINNGDIIVAKKINSPTEIEADKIYIFVLNDTVLVKRLSYEIDQIILKSDNPFFDPIIIKKSQIISLYKVVMLCKAL